MPDRTLFLTFVAWSSSVRPLSIMKPSISMEGCSGTMTPESKSDRLLGGGGGGASVFFAGGALNGSTTMN